MSTTTRRWLGSRATRLVLLVVGLGSIAAGLTSDCPAVSYLAGVSALALIAEFLSLGPQAVPFSASDWTQDAEGLSIEIPWRKHLRLHPNVSVWQRNADGSLQEVLCDRRARGNTTILRIQTPGFDGEARLH